MPSNGKSKYANELDIWHHVRQILTSFALCVSCTAVKAQIAQIVHEYLSTSFVCKYVRCLFV